jgi:translation initiation factor IF-2
MSDENKGDKKTGKPLTLRGGTETSRVRQSFSHGRTKSVVVEKKRKRVVVPGKPGTPGATTPSGVKNAPRPVGISDAEMDRRIKALEAAAAQESERQAREAAEAKEREEEREQRRSEIQEREREEQERQEAIATREQEDQDQEAATKKATRRSPPRKLNPASRSSGARRNRKSNARRSARPRAPDRATAAVPAS